MRIPVDLGVYGEYLHYGMPLTLVTVLEDDGSVNVTTIASITPLPGEPSRLVMGILEENYTSQLVEKRGEFVVNLITPEMRSIARVCGMYSGKEADKMAICELHPQPAQYVQAPLLEECPLNIECQVEHVLRVDELYLFISKILVLEVAPELADGRGGVQVDKLRLLFYAFGNTFASGPMIGHEPL